MAKIVTYPIVPVKKTEVDAVTVAGAVLYPPQRICRRRVPTGTCPGITSYTKISMTFYYVYILLCKDGSLYTGSTNNINQRIKDHFNGKGGRYTRSHKPQKLVYQEKLPNKSEALKREAQLKKLTKVKKQALITGKL